MIDHLTSMLCKVEDCSVLYSSVYDSHTVFISQNFTLHQLNFLMNPFYAHQSDGIAFLGAIKIFYFNDPKVTVTFVTLTQSLHLKRVAV